MDYDRYSICLEFVSDSINSLVSHIGRIHRNEPDFHVICGIDGCAKTYKTFWSFQNHLISKYDTITNKERQDDHSSNDGDDMDNINAGNGDEQFDLEREEAKICRTNAMCLLKFKEKGRVPQTVVDSFIKSATYITRNSIDLLKSGLINNLQTAGIDFDTVSVLNDMFNDNNVILDPFSGIDKEPLQYKYYKDQFNLVLSLATLSSGF